jgi:hypothetical protein
MYPGDARNRWRSDLLTDRRVQHWWDERKLTGIQLTSDVAPLTALRAPGSRVFDEEILWDAYLLFDTEARWHQSLPQPVTWGYTILAAKEALGVGVRKLIASR